MTYGYNDAARLSLSNGTVAVQGGGGNTGGGDAGFSFEAVYQTGGSVIDYQDGTWRSLGAAGGASSLRKTVSAASQISAELELEQVGTPSGDVWLLVFEAAGSNVLKVTMTAAGLLKVYDVAGQVGSTGTVDLRGSGGLRIHAGCDLSATVANIEVHVYTGDDGKSTTPVETVTTSAGNTGTTTIDTVVAVKDNTTPSHSVYYRNLQYDDSKYAAIGPLSLMSPMAATTRMLAPTGMGGTVLTGGGPMAATTRMLIPFTAGDLFTVELGTGALPHIRVVILGPALPEGDAWALTGATAGGFTWTVRGGSGTGAGAQVVLADALAPVNELLTYTLTVAGSVVGTAQITRTYSTGGDAFASLDAGTVAPFTWLASGGDRRQSGRRFHASDVAGSRFSPLRLDTVAGAGGGSMVAATNGTSTTTLRALIDGNRVLVRYHDESLCQFPSCDLDPVAIMYFTAASDDRTSRTDVAERAWSLGYVFQGDPDADYITPLQTWDDFDAAGLDFDALDALGLTWDEFDRTTWSEVGA